MRTRLLFLLLLAAPAFAQTGPYILQTLSGPNGTVPTTATLNAATFGTTGGGTWSVHAGANNGMFYDNNPCGGTFPPGLQGQTALSLSTTAMNGNGSGNAMYLLYSLPASGVSGTGLFTEWVCTDLPQYAVINCDCVTFYGSGTGGNDNFTNAILLGSCDPNIHPLPAGCPSNDTTDHLSWAIEGGNGPTHPPMATGQWVQVAVVYQQNGNGVERVFDVNGNQLGSDLTLVNANGLPNRITIGNGLNFNTLAGYHIWYMWPKFQYITGTTNSQFPLMEYPVPLWDGILNPQRAMDWTQTGFNGGVLPDSGWTQCGSTLAAGTYAASTLTTNMSGCGANTYYLLGPGTFTITGGIVNLPRNGHFVMRGSGSNSTKLVWNASVGTQCGQLNAAVCIRSSDTNNVGSNPTRYDWTAGYAQGTNQITLSSTTNLNSTDPTILVLDQCDTGFTGGGTCTGSPADNSQLYICGTSGTCSFNGGASNHRDQMEMHSIASIAGSVVTLAEPLIMPNWASGQSPQVWFFRPVVQTGLENLSIDVTAINGASCLETFNAYQAWVSGVVCNGAHYGAFNRFESIHGLVQSNYIYTVDGAGSCGPGDACGVRTYIASYERIENNISQGYFDGGVFFDGVGGIGNAVFANLVLKTDGNNGTLNNAITEHTTNEYNLFEQNYTVQVSMDSTHGLSDMATRFRNHVLGWESNPAHAVAGSAIVDCQGSRYGNNIGNVLGTPGYTTTYLSTTNGSHAAYSLGNCGGTPPSDPLTKSTSTLWASYDIQTGTVRYCGASFDTGWGTTCASTSEIPTAASTYPNYVPVKGDTAAGEPALPPSFIYTSRPGWWPVSIPFPAIGPDVTGGNMGVCSGSLNVVGQFNGMPAYNNTQCGGHGITASSWAGHVNGIPAANCYLNVMNGTPDGSGAILAFDSNACYSGSAPTSAVTFTPSSLNFGNVPQGMTSNPLSVTLTSSGTATLNVSQLTFTNVKFRAINSTCGASTSFSLTTPSASFSLTPGATCTFQVIYQPPAVNADAGGVQSFDDSPGSPNLLILSGNGTGTPAPTSTLFATVSERMNNETSAPVPAHANPRR